MVGYVGQVLRLPQLHIEDDKRRRTMAENPLGKLPKPIAAVEHNMGTGGQITHTLLPQLKTGGHCITNYAISIADTF